MKNVKPVPVQQALMDGMTCVMAIDGSQWLKVGQVAQLSGMSKDYILECIHEGRLKAVVPVGKRSPFLIEPEEYNRWIQVTFEEVK